ncbi:uncharacterized protein [Solanum tuberosum]|uniref:uncharacterized protein n=1 Tax=Solanum tuberosum TaxID=4113 RepID=UPI000739FF12|nr:PREDICTED: uncharacterized protein LOC107062643 [Solanum tuberosum]
MTKINRKRYTKEDQVSPLNFGLTKEQVEKTKNGTTRCENDDIANSKADHDKCLAVLTRSGKITGGDVKVNDELNTSGEKKDTIDVERSDQAPDNNMPEEEEECTRQITTRELQIAKERATFSSKLTLSINLPLVEALLEMPGYAKFVKELVTKKISMDFEMIEVSHNCSVVMTSDLITKKEDPGAFTIPSTIGMLQFAKALCDLGESINLMSYTIFKQLGLGEPKSTTMRLLMAYRSIKHRAYYLGRPFLATERALVDVESGELKFRVNDEEVTFNACKSMKQPSDIHVVSTIDVIDEAVASVSEMMCMGEPLVVVLSNYDGDEVQGYDEVVAALSGLGAHSRNPLKLDNDLKYRESPPAKPSKEEPPKLALKVLPSHLQYVFLGANNTLPVIIATNLL